MQPLKDHQEIQKQTTWIIEFLNTISISQNRENLPLWEMEINDLKASEDILELEFCLFESENFQIRKESFQNEELESELYYEKREWLKIAIHKNQEIHFSWQEEIYANNPAYDVHNVLSKYYNSALRNGNECQLSPYEEFQILVEAEGTVKEQLFVTNDQISLQLKDGDAVFAYEPTYEQYPKPLQHLIKELIQYSESWQRYFFPFNTQEIWKPSLQGPQDVIIRIGFKEYIKELYGKEFFNAALLGAPSFLHLQLLEYSENDLSKFTVLKEHLFKFKEDRENWPKDFLQVIFDYYHLKFIKPFDDFDRTILFILMRFYHFPFQPEVLSMKALYKKVGEERPDLKIIDLYRFDSGYEEWAEWLSED